MRVEGREPKANSFYLLCEQLLQLLLQVLDHGVALHELTGAIDEEVGGQLLYTIEAGLLGLGSVDGTHTYLRYILNGRLPEMFVAIERYLVYLKAASGIPII